MQFCSHSLSLSPIHLTESFDPISYKTKCWHEALYRTKKERKEERKRTRTGMVLSLDRSFPGELNIVAPPWSRQALKIRTAKFNQYTALHRRSPTDRRSCSRLPPIVTSCRVSHLLSHRPATRSRSFGSTTTFSRLVVLSTNFKFKPPSLPYAFRLLQVAKSARSYRRKFSNRDSCTGSKYSRVS